MNKDFKTYHDFEKASVYKENGEYLVNINISSKREMVGFSYKAKGQIIISLKDLSIYSFKYRVFDQSQTPLFKLFIEYQKIDHLMFLKYISFHNKFQVQDGEPFQESSILFEKENFKLKIAFNKPVDKASLLKRNFEIKLFGRKIKVKDITIKDSMNVEVLLKKKRLEQYSMADISENIMIRMSQIRATNGLLIYKARYKPYFQLREFFVQETLPLKTKSIADKVIDKNQPLEKAFINPNSSLKNYIINSPLNNYNKEEK